MALTGQAPYGSQYAQLLGICYSRSVETIFAWLLLVLRAQEPAIMSIADNIVHVCRRIAEAAERAGREPSDVTLVAVSKGFGVETIEQAAAAGLSVFGENRVQEAAEKISVLPSSLEWHMLGHVQSNKAKQAEALFDRIHSVDSVRLASALARHAADQGRCIPILIQVNVTGKESQFGLPPTDVPAVARSIAACTGIRIDGLMAIASFTEDEVTLRAEFRALRQLRDRLKSIVPDHPCRELSMGMTNDYPIAIEEGATIVRVGRAIFGERPLPQSRYEPKKVLQGT